MSLTGRNPIRYPFSSVLVTGPTVEPVELEELKEHPRLRITDTDSDHILKQMIKEARQEIEDTYSIALINQTWQMTLDAWPPGKDAWWDGVRVAHINTTYAGGTRYGTVELPRFPLSSITSVTVYDEDNNSTAVTVATTFDIDTTSKRGRISLQSGATWPSALRANKAIEINYVAGYGAAASAVPAPLKRAVKEMASVIYDGCPAGDALVKSGAAKILERYRAVTI